ncbi:MAG: translocation/assembly module TamB domain-containing protein [Chitinophagaceae bacterium]
MKEHSEKIKRSIGLRITRIVLKTVLFLLLFFILLVILIQTAPVQNFIRGKAVAWLEKKLKTKVEVGKIYIGFPKDVVIENVYLEDRTKDTLFSGGEIKADISLLKIINGNIEINDLFLGNITAKVKRQLPDTAFNFQFIIDAFVSKNKTEDTSPKDTANHFNIRNVRLDKIRLLYNDTLTGNDAELMLGHFETKISRFDLTHLSFEVPKFSIENFAATVRQFRPLKEHELKVGDTMIAQKQSPLHLDLKEISLNKINVDYKNDVSSIAALLDLEKLLVHPDKIDLENNAIDIDDILLQGTTASIKLGKPEKQPETKKEEKNSSAAPGPSWKISLASFKSDSNNIKFDDESKALSKKGMDYSHIDAKAVTFDLDKFFLGNDSISGNISKASLKEKSGLNLQRLDADFTYGSKGASLNKFYIKTPGTELQRDVAIHYASTESLKKDLKNAELDITLQKSKLQIKDLLLFVPSLQEQAALKNPESFLYLNTDIHGKIGDLKIAQLQLNGLSDTRVDIAGTIHGLPDAKNINANLVIKSLQSSKDDILLFVPPSSLPDSITIPDKFSLTGNLKGNKNDFTTNLSLATNLGKASINATGKNITDKVRSAYDAKIETNELDIGAILQKKELLGPVTATFTIKGTGTDKHTANAALDGMIQSAVFKKYTYHNLALSGSISNQSIKVKAGTDDPNIDFNLDAIANLSAKYPSVQLHMMIDSIKTLPLHFTPDAIVYHGKIDADFPVADLDSLEGKLEVTNSLLVKDSLRLKMDTIRLLASRSDSGRAITLNSDVVNANLTGKYKLSNLSDILQRSIEPYFSVSKNDSQTIEEHYDFTLNAIVLNKPILKTFLPGLQKLDSIRLTSHFTDHSGWNADLIAPAVDLNDNSIRKLEIRAGTGNDELIINANVAQVKSGNSIQLFNTTVNAEIKNNKIDFAVNIHDKADKNKYNLKGVFEQPAKGVYAFSLKPDSLLLNYDKWTISPDNKIQIGDDYILANNFKLDQNGQQLLLQSNSQDKKSPLEVSFQNFKLETLTAFVQPDSTLIGGTLNGKADISDLPKSPVFTSDLTIENLNIRKDTAGNLKILVNNKVADTYNADITLTGKGNDVRINGNYFAKQADNNFDLVLNIKQLPLTTAQVFSDGAIRNASGSVNGSFNVKGNIKQPRINGDLNFVQAAFNPAKLNSLFKIDNEKIQVNEQGISFNQFTITDSSGNKLTLNGKAETTNFTNYNFDFTVRANNFQALSSTKKDNKLFYGQLFFNTNLNVKGTEQAPSIDGRLTINDKTKMTVVLPQEDPGVTDREGIVEFVDKDAPANDSLFLKAFDTLNTSSYKGMDIAVNVDVKKEADLTLIVDEGSGDFLNVHGEALLTTGIDPSGKITMAGSYELEDGAYQLTFNLLKRKFNIQKGSKIIWGGEPTQADVNITAAYEVSTPPLDLVKNQLGDVSDASRNTYLQKLPFQVFLKMTGKLLQPQISFDIVLPEDKEYNVSADIVSNVRTKLEMLRLDEGELNKQVFALLLLNRFVGENPFNSSTSTSAETLVRQSASKLLTEQLNRLAENLVQGVDLNFDVQSSDDYTTGERRDRTDLNVGLSKKLLNDRLTVTVGSNFELEGPQNSNQQSSNIAGNVALNYRLSKDGRYALRAYRKNEYEGVLDGYVIETGVGFIITIDYNKFRQIFQKKTPRKQPQKDAQKQNSDNTTTTTPSQNISDTRNSKP